MDFKTFEFRRTGGGVLTEYINGSEWRFEYCEGKSRHILPIYEAFAEIPDPITPYLGHSLDEVLDSGEDILGKELTKEREIEYSDIVGALPALSEGAYCFIGGTASHSDLIVDTRGAVYPQMTGRDRTPASIFEPWTYLKELEGISPRQFMLCFEYPILINLFEKADKAYELIYFVEPGDSDKEPILWVREKAYAKGSENTPTYTYRAIPMARELNFEDSLKNPVPEKNAIEALADTIAFWLKFSKHGASIDLPEKRLEKATRGALAAAAVTCAGDRPHYGHKFYGKELHDNFPPNYIWLIETLCVMGRDRWAKRVFEYMINYALNDEGRFVYRQGADLNMGSSAAEYGCILFLADRYFAKLGISDYSEDQIERLVGMGDMILAHCVKCPEFGGKTLVKMCAEADTNDRVHVYLNNNLWSVKGLCSLASILSKLGIEEVEKYRCMAEELLKNTKALLNEKSIYDERFGFVPPFRFDYTPKVHTLSRCKQTFYPMTEAEFAEYAKTKISRFDQDCEGQDIGENCYANYRYIPEALSAMLLPKKYADGAEALREKLGGEILGMTRFDGWIDNWPVLHHARFLIETGRIDKYLLLLYAHTELHGNREKLCYYEQMRLNGRVGANDCLPSLLTTPCMVGWMFVYERMNGTISLLSAVPKEWFKSGFDAGGIGYSNGSVDLSCDGKSVNVRFSSATERCVEITLRNKEFVSLSDILIGADFVEQIKFNKLFLKPGVIDFKIAL